MHGDEGATQSEVLTIGTRRITYIRRFSEPLCAGAERGCRTPLQGASQKHRYNSGGVAGEVFNKEFAMPS